MNYKMNTNIKYFLPNTVLFEADNNPFTVAMAKNAMDYALGFLARKDLRIDAYKKAKTVFSAIKAVLENKSQPKPKKDFVKAAIDVIEEIKNLSAQTESEKEYNARYAFWCKCLVDGFYGDVR